MNKPEFIVKYSRYEGCTATFEEAEVVLVGAGFDGTSTYRPGSRFAPQALRSETVLAQEDYSPYLKRDLRDKPVHDLGDIDIAFGNKEETLRRIESASRFILESGKKPFFLGGEHLITLPIIRPFIEKYPDLHIIQFDAHLDLMDKLFGDHLSHGTVMRRIIDILPEPYRVYQVGIRSGSKEEFLFAESNTRLFPFDHFEFLKNVDELKGKPIYLSIDLDVFDPSLIPGTGTPEAGGLFFHHFVELLNVLDELHIVGGDMVELAPQIDPTNVSTIIASKILRELLLIL